MACRTGDKIAGATTRRSDGPAIEMSKLQGQFLALTTESPLDKLAA